MVNGSLTVVILITRIGCGDSLVNKTHRLILNRRTKQEQNPKLAWVMPCKEEEDEVNVLVVLPL